MNRVYITGIGAVSPVGSNIARYWQSLLEETTTANQIFDEFSDRIDNRHCYTCPEYLELNDMGGGRTQQLALNAIAEAIQDAGLESFSKQHGGVVVGTTMGDEPLLETLREKNISACDFPFQISASIAKRFGLYGPNLTISNACTSGLYGIDLAANAIRRGETHLMIAGGVESASRIVISCFNRLGALDEGVCKPFDETRKGTVLGEGAAFIVLESEEHMKNRDHAGMYCEYKGSGWSCDAHQPTAPEPSGEQIERALCESLASSKLRSGDIDCILPHGTGTPLNDSVEALVLTKQFGKNKKLPIITAIKSKLGHSGGASGAFSIVTACLILKHKCIPPTAHLKNKSTTFTLPIPVDIPLKQEINNILVNAYAFGGNNISVVLSKP